MKWWQRRASVLAAGTLALLLAVVVMALNEHRVAAAALTVTDQVLDLGATTPGANAEGRVVRLAGTTTVTRPAQDLQFGVTASAPVLQRTVSMLQWHEIDVGGGAPSYDMRWLDHVEDSTRFQHPEGHANPTDMAISNARFEASEVRLDGVGLARVLVDAIPGRESYPVDVYKLPPNLVASFAQDGDGLTTADYPPNPRLGDLRVNWTVVPNGEVTVLAMLRNGHLQPAPTLPAPGFVMMVGNMPMAGLLPGVPVASAWPWPWRILAVLLALVGAGLLLAGLATTARPDVPAVLALAAAPLALTMLVAWWNVRAGVVMLGLLVVAAAIGVLVWRRHRWLPSRRNAAA